MIIKNIKFLTYLYFLEGFLLLLFTPSVESAFYYKNENDIVRYTTAKSVLNSNPLYLVDIKGKKYQKSSSRQIIKYYKSTHRNVLPVDMDKNEKNVETLSLLSLSYPKYSNDNPPHNNNNNSTDYLKQKNGILQKLDTLNKKLKETFKQLQATTSKSFINFNFNHTQIKEFSTILSYPLMNTKSTTEEDPTHLTTPPATSQKNSIKSKSSSIPKPSYHCLKYLQKNKISSSSDSDSALPRPHSGNADPDTIKVLRNEMKSKDKKDTKDPTLPMNKTEKESTPKYHMLYPLFYSALIKLSKTENKIEDKGKSKHSDSPSLPIPIKKRELLEKDIVKREKDNNYNDNDNNNSNNNNNNNNNRNYDNENNNGNNNNNNNNRNYNKMISFFLMKKKLVMG